MTVLWLVTKDYGYEAETDPYWKAKLASRVGFGQTLKDHDGQNEQIVAPRINVHTDLNVRMLDPNKDPVQWRVKDDDGEVYYEGLMSIECFEDNETVTGPLDWARADAGATDLEYRRSLLDDWAPL